MTYPNIYAAQVGPLALATLDANFLWATDIQSQAITANAGGTADAITATYIPAVTALINGLTLYVRASASNATTTPQFSPNGLTARTIVKATGSLVVGDIAGAGHWLQLTYDTTLVAWVLSNPADTQGGNLQATSINGGQLAGLRNRIINGGMQVAQRGSQVLSTTGSIYGWVDRWLVSVSGTTVSALGYQAADSNSSTGISLQIGNVTTTGATTVYISQRIESLNSASLNGKTVTISGKIRHNIGSTQTANINVLKANSVDNFAGTTAIGSPASTTVSIPDSVAAPFTFTTTFGASDCANGIQVNVGFFSLSALSNKQFYFSDVQLEVGSVATPFEQRPYGMELALCQRYYYRISPAANTYYGIGLVGAATTGAANIQFKVSMRSAPTALEQTGTASDYKVATTTTALVACTAVPTHLGSTNTESATIGFTSGTLGGTAGQVTFFASGGVSTSYLGWSAEL